MKYINGHILICTTDEIYGQKHQNLVVGHKYVIIDSFDMSEDRIILEVQHLSTSKRIGFVSDRHFIPLDVWREFQLRNLSV